jgi:hypothetical protein
MGATMRAAQSERLTKTLWVSAAFLAIVSAGAVLWQPALEIDLPDESAGALLGDSVSAFTAARMSNISAADRIIANNLFAATRRAPGKRFSPRTAAQATDPGDAGPVFDPSYSADAPSLLGTVLDALGDRALLLASPADSLARFYRVGDRVGAFRIRRIDVGRVTLDGPSGRVVLDLKPNEARP